MTVQNFAVVGPLGMIVNRIVVEIDEAGNPVHLAQDDDGTLTMQPFTLDGADLIADPGGLAAIGGAWNGSSFEAPSVPEEPKRTRYSPLEFMDLFTEDEQLAVVTAVMSSAPIKLWYDRMIAAEWIETTDPRTIGGVQALVTAGLLSADRATEVLGS